METIYKVTSAPKHAALKARKIPLHMRLLRWFFNVTGK